MYEIEGRIRSYKDTPWCSNPKAYQNIVHEDDNVIVFKDRFPVTEGHLLYVPKKVTQQLDITRCFELAYKRGVRGICEHEWDAFNVGINNGEEAGQSVMWPHVHLIPRRKGDNPNPKGGVRGVIPMNQDYDDTTEDDWENEGGMAFLPVIDDNSSREELDNWKERYEGYREYKEEKSVPAPCSRTALVRDRYIDDIKSGMKTERFKKVDDDVWDEIVQRMKDRTRGK
jgi:diadenosine tetraphosphate (Ap4A) HIT family hydrolase